MDARILRTGLIFVSLLASTGASFQTRNFTVTAPDAETAQMVGEAAETYRRDLATFWLGQPLPNWSRPCTLKVKTGALGAGGETKFQFVRGEVVNWNMSVQGSLERILDSVLPHEVNHTIFACHFRRPLPRWADEGAATLFEHRSEQLRQHDLLNHVIKSERELISLDRLLTMKEYPRGYRPMLILYAEGYALADFLVQQGGQKKYLEFLHDGERIGWTKAIKKNYAHGGVTALQKNWKGWILAGMPKLTDPREEMLAARDRITDNAIQGRARPLILDQFPVKQTMRSQSPGGKSPTAARPASSRRRSTTTSQPASLSPRRSSAGSMPAPLPQRPSRSASFEAPRPVKGPAPQDTTATELQSGNSPKRSSVVATILPNKGRLQRRELETTAASRLPENKNNIRKHLPQKRNVMTGSIPQWAGFPGQTESF